MFEALIEFTPEVADGETVPFTPEKRLSPAAAVDGKFNTAKFLNDLGIEDDPQPADGEAARAAFSRMISGQDPEKQKAALAELNTPVAVKQLVGMLTAYDWNFVEQAAELRGYTLAGILTETKHPEARVRLKALELLGKVTEVAMFTERVEVKQTGISDEELERQLREKLEKFMGMAQQVNQKIDDISFIEDAKILEAPKPTTKENETL